LDTLSKVDKIVKKLKSPTGERDAPAASCDDFRKHNTELVDGLKKRGTCRKTVYINLYHVVITEYATS
jgi:hypothetical protein